MLSKELLNLKKNPSFLGIYSEGLILLQQSGIFNFLRELARPRIISMGADQSTMATQAAYSAGFSDCLENLLNFKELYFLDEKSTQSITPHYGAKDIALEKGDLTEDEINAIRTNSEPEYIKRFRADVAARAAAIKQPTSNGTSR